MELFTLPTVCDTTTGFSVSSSYVNAKSLPRKVFTLWEPSGNWVVSIQWRVPCPPPRWSVSPTYCKLPMVHIVIPHNRTPLLPLLSPASGPPSSLLYQAQNWMRIKWKGLWQELFLNKSIWIRLKLFKKKSFPRKYILYCTRHESTKIPTNSANRRSKKFKS